MTVSQALTFLNRIQALAEEMIGKTSGKIPITDIYAMGGGADRFHAGRCLRSTELAALTESSTEQEIRTAITAWLDSPDGLHEQPPVEFILQGGPAG